MKPIIPIAFALGVIVVVLVGVYEISTLRAELVQQRTEIDRLNEFVDAQAGALTACQKAMGGLTDFAINKSTLGMFGSVDEILTLMGDCNDAVTKFNQIASTSRD